RGHPQRHLLAGRAALRAPDRHDAAGARAAADGGTARAGPADQGGGGAAAQRPAERLGSPAQDRGGAPDRARAAARAGAGGGRGELDWIVMRCLEKDRARRYETASGLARDVERYLADEPVEAGPPGPRYRLSKFARKHRTALVTAAAFAILLVAGVVVSTWQ